MSSSITLKSDVLRGSRYFQLKCTQKSNGSAENSSTITWELSAVDDSYYYATGPTKVIINGTTVYSKERIPWYGTGSESNPVATFPAAQGSVSGKITIPHNNDGTKKITVKFSTAVYYTTVHEYSDEWTIDNIPRYPTVSHSLDSKTETTAKISWSSDSTIDYLWYSKDDGKNWTGVNVTDGKSGTYTISGLSANTTYKIKTRVRRKDSQLTKDSSALSVTTYNFPYCTKAPNFVIGNPVTLEFYNPLKREIDFILIGNGQHIYAWTGIKAAADGKTTYTGITEGEVVTALYDSIPNAKNAKYTIETVYGDSFIPIQGGTYSVNESQNAPTFTTFTYKDTNATVTAVTGNAQAIVQGLSNLAVEITADNKMIAKNRATPDYYSASIDTLSKTGDYSATATVTIPLGVISSAGAKRLNVRAYDSRAIPKLVYKDITVYAYAKPKISASIGRLNNFEAQTTLKVSGEYSRLTIGGADKNTIKSVQFRYREKNGTWSSWENATFTASAGKFTCTDVVKEFDNSKAFDIEVKVEDNFGTLTEATEPLSIDVGEAIFFISSNKRKCYINGDEVVPLNLIHPVGSVICTSTNTNPSATYGGTWELIDKGFKSQSGSDEDAFTADSGVVVNNLYITRGGNTTRIRLNITVNADMTDTGHALGKFNWGKVGISSLPMGYNEGVSYSDGANGGMVWSIVYDTGALSMVDVFDLSTLPSGSKYNIDFTFVTEYTRMLDSVCDKFYWKRTAL